MTVISDVIHFFVKKQLPPGFERTEAMEQALQSTLQRYRSEIDELLNDLTIIREVKK